MDAVSLRHVVKSYRRGRERVEVLQVHDRHRQQDECRQRDDLDADQDRVDVGALLGAEHEQPGDQKPGFNGL